MQKVKKTASEKLVRLPMTRVKSLHAASVLLADLTEEILETHGEYSKEFLSALSDAERDVKAGRVSTVTSIKDLIPSA